MSSKGDKAEKSGGGGGSKMLKKARSFREDFKGFIKRRPSSTHTSPVKSTKVVRPLLRPNSGTMTRHNSLSVSSKAEKGGINEDVQKLKDEEASVHRSLRYIKEVVDKEKLQILPTSATIVLETVMEVFTLLSSYFMKQDSSTLSSRHSQVYQSLAQFIRWADAVAFTQKKQTVDKDNANEIIKALADGIQELTQLSIEKLEHLKSLEPKCPIQRNSTSQLTPIDSPTKLKHCYLDVPLTPREREILDQTSIDSGVYESSVAPSAKRSQSSDSLLMTNYIAPPPLDDIDGLSMSMVVPPKPPLPPGKVPILNSRSVRSSSMDDILSRDAPPPLPQKKRSSQTNIRDIISSSTPKSAVSSNSSSYSNLFLYPNESGDSSLISLDQSSPLSQSPHSISPLSRSPASSVGSGLNQSLEDMLRSVSRGQMQHTCNTIQTMRAASESKVSVYDNVGSSGSEPRSAEQINQFTLKMNQLTSSISDRPPNLPEKQRTFRLMSQYDNIPEGFLQQFVSSNRLSGFAGLNEFVSNRASFESHFSQCSSSSSSSSFSSTSTGHRSAVRASSVTAATAASSVTSSLSSSSSSSQHQKTSLFNLLEQQKSVSQELHAKAESCFTCSENKIVTGKPPPLPPKKKAVQAYMQTIGSYTQPVSLDMSRHSVNFYESQWHQFQVDLFQPLHIRSKTISTMSDISSVSDVFSMSSAGSGFGSLEDQHSLAPALPIKQNKCNSQRSLSSSGYETNSTNSDIREKSASLIETPISESVSDVDPKRSSAPANMDEPLSAVKTSKSETDLHKDTDSDFSDSNPLDDIQVVDQLVYKNEKEDGPDIRGGAVDALVVHATAAGKNGSQDEIDSAVFLYQEAFLTTYRTFISSKQLIDKLLYRFNKFFHASDAKKRLAKNAFSLIIRVIDELGWSELEDYILQKMMDLVFELLCQGELRMAKILRWQVIEKCEQRRRLVEASHHVTLLSSIHLTSIPPDLLQFKSHEIAEQMTKLDANLFQKIEIPEVLLWAKEQSEELSPNLTTFTEHFNKMSYWCRTKILVQEELKDRERYLMKFIKIMRHLRKLNNFNSYLAILSAVDSAPIRRLEWQKQNMEALKEFCELIDSSSSFRAYRQALKETAPPCIPYIGLILQDLTFINIGNPDHLAEGSINFAKRWQQFNILDNMRRFKKCNYQSKKNDRILVMLNNFDEYHSEEVLWQISEKIKPRRGAKKKQPSQENS